MSQDVRQWLAEIKLLQQKLVAAQQERDEAYASAANWRSLYEAEAKQRRTETHLAQQNLEALKAENQRMRELPQSSSRDSDALAIIQKEVDQLQNVEELKLALIRALTECDRLSRALRTEQSAHSQTRNALTTALGDTVDLLAKERVVRKRTRQNNSTPANSTTTAKVGGANGTTANGTLTNGTASKTLGEIKNPSLELPPFE